MKYLMELEKNYKVYKILLLKTLRINFKKVEAKEIGNIEKNLIKPRSKSKKKKKRRKRRKSLEFYPGSEILVKENPWNYESESRPDLPVVPQVILPSEGLSANVARVRPLVGVRSLVYQQIIALGELAATELADELLFGPGRPARPRYPRLGGGGGGLQRRRGGQRGRGQRGRGGRGASGRRLRGREGGSCDLGQGRGGCCVCHGTRAGAIPIRWYPSQQGLVIGWRGRSHGCVSQQRLLLLQQGQIFVRIPDKVQPCLVLVVPRGLQQPLRGSQVIALDRCGGSQRGLQPCVDRRTPLIAQSRTGTRRLADTRRRATRVEAMKGQVSLQRLEIQGGGSGMSRW